MATLHSAAAVGGNVFESEPDVEGLRLLISADTLGGVFSHALTLASELCRRGATVHLATMGAQMRESERVATSAVPNLIVHESTYALEWMADPWEDVARAADWLLEIERLAAPDVVHLNGYCHATAGFRAPVVVAGHSCVLSWWQAVHGIPAPVELDRYRIEVARGLDAAGAVIAPTAAMMRALRSHYGPFAVQAVVPHCAYAPVGPPSVSKQRSVLAVGRLWDRAKNIESLARVAAGFAGPVRVAGPDRRFDGSVCSFPNVEFLGWLEGAALGRAMEAAAVFAHPARYEPFGLTTLEAALRRCALVLGDIPSLREVWGDAAFYVDPDDDEALASALDAFACDEEIRRHQADRAHARASTFTPERMTNETVAVYARLLGSQKHSSAPQAPQAGGVMPSCA